jgi:uncharacterized protein DUF935
VTEVVVSLTAPLSVKGYVDPFQVGSRWGSLYGDILEHIPDLMFPNSVQVYARMRRDPQVSAILQGWTLQLRRAQWQLDPSGCRDEVVRRVADDMGLGVVGDDKPGAARLRGVSWGEHLRAALGMLPFGFSAFEMQADASTGVARLEGLLERPQWTIPHIHVDGKTGALLGATQDRAAVTDSPQISADRLVWYAHEREGANWAGTSLLRSCYASWLIKEEMRRIHGISNKRWGAGVPVMEALPGTNPSPAAMTEAMQMAAAARAGETAGAASPPGFVLKLIGLSGSVPDTLGFIRWLDQQMSRTALMGFLDLGDTSNGSRALGEAFVDSLMLALEAAAEHVADVATRQIAARLVDWNYGDSEPVPRVRVSGIGSRREITAESLQMLLSSGALAADPGLEAWVRREYRLPEREDADEQPVKVPGSDLPKPSEPPADPPAASVTKPRARAPRRHASGQMTLFNAADDAEPDPERIQQQWEQAKADLLKRWPKKAQPMVDELADQARAAVEADDLGLLGELAVSAGVIAAVALMLKGKSTKLASDAAANVVAEAAKQDVNITAPDSPGEDRVHQTADAVAAIIAAGYASGAARSALQQAGVDPQAVRDAVAAHLETLGTSTNGLVGDNIGGLLTAAQAAGRLAVLEAHPADHYVAVETNDQRRCSPCGSISGATFSSLADAIQHYPMGYKDCSGGGRCRGYVHPIYT